MQINTDLMDERAELEELASSSLELAMVVMDRAKHDKAAAAVDSAEARTLKAQAQGLKDAALASRVDTEVYKLEFEKAMQQSAEVMETKQKVVSDLVAQAREVRGVSPTRRRRSSLSGAAD